MPKILCTGCGRTVDEDECIWANSEGKLTVSEGNPYCDSCLPMFHNYYMDGVQMMAKIAEMLPLLRKIEGKDMSNGDHLFIDSSLSTLVRECDLLLNYLGGIK